MKTTPNAHKRHSLGPLDTSSTTHARRRHHHSHRRNHPSHPATNSLPSPPPSDSNSRSASLDSKLPETPPKLSPRVIYGPGTILRLSEELRRLGVSSGIIISSPSRVALAKHVQGLIPNINSRILDSAITLVPAHVVDDVLERISGRDCVISVGGGSAVNFARSIAQLKAIPHICIPTTYSGSEVTPYLAGGRDGRKIATSRKDKMLPEVIIYDEDLTMSLPTRFSAPSGSSSKAHSSESSHRTSNDQASWSFMNLPGV